MSMRTKTNPQNCTSSPPSCVCSHAPSQSNVAKPRPNDAFRSPRLRNTGWRTCSSPDAACVTTVLRDRMTSRLSARVSG
eukprot:1181434-Prorocentrum_minimum.AAC.2